MKHTHHTVVLLFAALILLTTNLFGQVTVDTTSQTHYQYDMGTTTSSVDSGWVKVSQATTGDISWTPNTGSNIDSRERGVIQGVSNVVSDLVYSSDEVSFNHLIANGEWKVIVILGDQGYPHDEMAVALEGTTIGSSINTAAGNFEIVSGTVTVTDGVLNITISDNGGNDANWVINGIVISDSLSFELPKGFGEFDADALGLKTLKDQHGENIRACPMTFGKTYPGPVAYAQDINTWWSFKDSYYNAVRLTWTGALKSFDPNRDVWTWPEMKIELDKIVAVAEATDMTLIINYHNVGEQQAGRNPNGPDWGMAWLGEFWENVAPWYSGNPHVIYELQNEPIFGPVSNYNLPAFKTRILEIYNKVRIDAPLNQIIMFSAPGHSYINTVVDYYENDLDWDYTTIGYHLYGGGTSAGIINGAQKHRLICTEWDYPVTNLSYVSPVDGEYMSSQTLEKLNQSWMDWSSHRGPSISRFYMHPDAEEKNYRWWDTTNTTVTFDAPTSDEIHYQGDDITVRISATDDGSVTLCKFYLNGIFVSDDITAPYEWSGGDLSNISAGNYIARIEVVDNEGHIEPITRRFSVLPGTVSNMRTLTPTADAYVKKGGDFGDGSDSILLASHPENEADHHKVYLKFDLSELNASTVESAKLRLYNTGNEAEGYIYNHELLADSWTEDGIKWSNAPKNTGILGQIREDRGGEGEPDLRFTHKNEWLEYDVTKFINQELAGNDLVSFQVSNHHESQPRYARFDLTEEIFQFGSRESNFSPQLIMGAVGLGDTLPVTGVKFETNIVSIYIDDEYRLQANIIPANSRDMTVAWSSSAPEVASVTDKGIVKGLTQGQAIITVTTNEGGFTATAEINVLSDDVTISVKPVAYWPFDETSGGVAADVIGSANAIWQNGSATWTAAGINGNAASLAGGANDKFIVGSDPLEGTTEFTIVGWVNLQVTDAYDGIITTRNGTGAQNWGIAAESIHLDARWDANPIDSDNILNTSEWFHVAMTWKNTGERELYFNGDSVGGDNSAPTTFATTGKWWFGDDICCNGRELNGKFDDFAMFDKVLSPQDIGAIYTSGVRGKALGELLPIVTVAVTGVSISPETLTLKIGKAGMLTETVSPANATDTTVSWTSGNNNIATVNDAGIVTAVAVGTTTIKATTTDGQFEATSDVTVTDSVTSLKEDLLSEQEGFSIYPNPAGKYTIVGIKLEKLTDVTVALYDVSGQKVSDYNFEKQVPGMRELRLELSDLSDGIYMLQINAGNTIKIKRLIINN